MTDNTEWSVNTFMIDWRTREIVNEGTKQPVADWGGIDAERDCECLFFKTLLKDWRYEITEWLEPYNEILKMASLGSRECTFVVQGYYGPVYRILAAPAWYWEQIILPDRCDHNPGRTYDVPPLRLPPVDLIGEGGHGQDDPDLEF